MSTPDLEKLAREIQRWEYYRDESPDGVFKGVRRSPVGQFVTYEDHVAALQRTVAEQKAYADEYIRQTDAQIDSLAAQLAAAKEEIKQLKEWT